MFDYQTSRAGAHARAFLHGWRGHLMVDDYADYKAMFADGPTELACPAHIRPKFFDVHAAGDSPIAEQALHRIASCIRASRKAPGWTRRSASRYANNWRGRRWPNCTPGSW